MGGWEVHGKPVYRGELLKGLKGKGLGQFANLRRGLAKKRRGGMFLRGIDTQCTLWIRNGRDLSNGGGDTPARTMGRF